MEAGVRVNPGFARLDLGLLVAQGRPHLLDLLAGGTPGGEGYEIRLNHLADLEQLMLVIPGLEEACSEGVALRTLGTGGQERPLAGAHLEQAQGFQGPDRLPDCRASRLEGLGKFALCGEPVPRLETARRDQVPDLFDDLLRDSGLADGPKGLVIHLRHQRRSVIRYCKG